MRPAPEPALFSERSDLDGLPFRKGAECYLFTMPAVRLEELSKTLHDYIAEAKPVPGSRGAPAGYASGADYLWARLSQDSAATWRVPDAVPTLVQILQAQDTPYRRLLVRMLSSIHGEWAAEALARRAAFDLSPLVREEAVYALRARHEKDYRRILLDALRHPWPAAAEFAAEAIVNLNMTSAIPELVSVLDQIGSSDDCRLKSRGNERTMVVRELVQVNHLKNCLLCHAASADRTDHVRGLVPDPDRLPTTSRTVYYRGEGLFARADVTYLVQDFSVLQPLVDGDKRVRHERFDYVVRTRSASPGEQTEQLDKKTDSPQRQSVLFALREMAGADLGSDVRVWERWLKGETVTAASQ